MVKSFKKAILLGIVLYAVIFLIGSIVMAFAGVEAIGKSMIIISPILLVLVAYWYLKKNAGLEEGLKLGLIWLLLSIILDIVVLVYCFKNGWIYFSSWTVWLGYGEMIIVPGIVGKLLEKK